MIIIINKLIFKKQNKNENSARQSDPRFAVASGLLSAILNVSCSALKI